ncbi:unnamed protein product [Pylaiella littoralis]
MEPDALLRINAEEELLVPVEVKVDWLSKQASMQAERPRATVGRCISQLDDVVRVRALFSIIRSTAPRSTAATPTVSLPAEGVGAAAAAAAAAAAQDDEPAGMQKTKAPSQGTATTVTVPPPAEEEKSFGGVLRRFLRNCSSANAPPPGSQGLEVFLRMAVSRMKDVLFQLASDEEKKERGDRCLFDVYEGLMTSETLYSAALEGFPTLDVDTVMLPKHFHYRKLIAARHRFLLRKLGVLLGMEDGVNELLNFAADTEALRDSLADVDLSSPQESSKEGATNNFTAAREPVLPHASAGPEAAKVPPVTRNKIWDEDAVGNDDTSEGETDEETLTSEEVSPWH